MELEKPFPLLLSKNIREFLTRIEKKVLNRNWEFHALDLKNVMSIWFQNIITIIKFNLVGESRSTEKLKKFPVFMCAKNWLTVAFGPFHHRLDVSKLCLWLISTLSAVGEKIVWCEFWWNTQQRQTTKSDLIRTKSSLALVDFVTSSSLHVHDKRKCRWICYRFH